MRHVTVYLQQPAHVAAILTEAVEAQTFTEAEAPLVRDLARQIARGEA